MSKWTNGARQMRGDIDTVCNGLTDEDAVNTPYLFAPWAAAEPVSYTHLDVYKRQALSRLSPFWWVESES